MTRESSAPPRQSEINRSLVLEAVRHSAGLTRAEIGRLTRLSPQTTSNVVRHLLAQGLLLETGTVTPEGRGRPGTTLQLNPHGGFAVGVHIDPSALHVVSVDLQGDLLAEHVEPLPHPEDPQQSLSTIAKKVEMVLARTGQPRSRMLGVGIATPGPIRSGRMTHPPLLPHWRDFPIQKQLARLTHSATLLDKDVNAAAQGYLWRRPTRSNSASKDFMFLYVGAGPALTTVLDGQVWRGHSGNAGEAGHLSGNSSGYPCFCGQRGCLGVTLGESEMVDRALQAGLPLTFHPGPHSHGDDEPFAALLSLARNGNPIAEEIFFEAHRVMNRVVTTLAELLEIDTLIIGGPRWPMMRGLLETPLRQSLSERVFYEEKRPIELISTPLGGRDAAVGAACLVLADTYSADVRRLEPLPTV